MVFLLFVCVFFGGVVLSFLGLVRWANTKQQQNNNNNDNKKPNQIIQKKKGREMQCDRYDSLDIEKRRHHKRCLDYA